MPEPNPPSRSPSEEDMDAGWERYVRGSTWVPHRFKGKWHPLQLLCAFALHDCQGAVMRFQGRDNMHYRCPWCGAAGGPVYGK